MDGNTPPGVNRYGIRCVPALGNTALPPSPCSVVFTLLRLAAWPILLKQLLLSALFRILEPGPKRVEWLELA